MTNLSDALTAYRICASALKNAIITDPALIPEQINKDLAPIISKYIK